MQLERQCTMLAVMARLSAVPCHARLVAPHKTMAAAHPPPYTPRDRALLSRVPALVALPCLPCCCLPDMAIYGSTPAPRTERC